MTNKELDELFSLENRANLGNPLPELPKQPITYIDDVSKMIRSPLEGTLITMEILRLTEE